MTTPRELHWLACREKACCHAHVVVTGHDVWRICEVLCVQPWDFTVCSQADDGAPDAFRLTMGGPRYHMALAKRGRRAAAGGPCTFLWKLNDGHAQCGLGELRPAVCRTYPASLVDGVLLANSSACTCRRWSVLDLDGDADRARLEARAVEEADYAAIVRRWNEALPETGARTYRDFCAYLLATYAARSSAVSP